MEKEGGPQGLLRSQKGRPRAAWPEEQEAALGEGNAQAAPLWSNKDGTSTRLGRSSTRLGGQHLGADQDSPQTGTLYMDEAPPRAPELRLNPRKRETGLMKLKH